MTKSRHRKSTRTETDLRADVRPSCSGRLSRTRACRRGNRRGRARKCSPWMSRRHELSFAPHQSAHQAQDEQQEKDVRERSRDFDCADRDNENGEDRGKNGDYEKRGGVRHCRAPRISSIEILSRTFVGRTRDARDGRAEPGIPRRPACVADRNASKFIEIFCLRGNVRVSWRVEKADSAVRCEVLPAAVREFECASWT
jgi:hypothetical protein